MGLLQASDWHARWIRGSLQTAFDKDTAFPSPWIRKMFELPVSPERAMAYVNVMGYYELYVNGRKVGTDVLSPAVSVGYGWSV